MKRWMITLLAFLVVGGFGASSYPWWLPQLLGFAKVNAEVIQGLSGMAELTARLAGGLVALAALVGLLRSRKPQGSSTDGPSVIEVRIREDKQPPHLPTVAPDPAHVTEESRTDDTKLSATACDYRDGRLLRTYFDKCARLNPTFQKYVDDEELQRRYLLNSGLARRATDGRTYLTYAGVLLCCNAEHIPRDVFHVDVKYVEGPGPGRRGLRDELSGPVLDLYDRLYDRLAPLWERTMRSPDIRDEGGSETVFFDYPKTAVVEALVNFLIHRNYGANDLGLIVVRPDRIVFTNPGKSEIPPEELMAAEDPLKVPRYRRNQMLIRAMAMAGLNQREGGGIVAIKHELRRNGSYGADGSLGLLIENDDENDRFTLTIFRRPARSEAMARITKEAALPVASLHQLSPAPADFTGREAELDQLMGAIAGRGATISGAAGIAGMGGVGKTALALKLADQLKERYPDAQFYLDLKGTTAQPLTPAEAMAHVIRAYHPDAKLPDGEAELGGLYRSVLDGQRAILLWDNAADEKQVEPLIPPASCVMLVTSRQRFTLPGIFHKDLDTLPPDDARALLLKIAPHIGDQADVIAELCGYLPLALRLAAGALLKYQDLTPEGYAKRLTDAKERLELVEASLDLSYRLLAPHVQKLWRALAVFPGTFDVLAAAAVWELEQETAQSVISELVAYSMVEWDEGTRRYHLHDLLRVLADSILSDDERAAAQQRHAEHYLGVLAAAKDLYRQGGDNIRLGLDLYDLESLNIEAGQRWAAEHAEDGEAARILCSKYPDAGVYVLDLRLHARNRIAWLEAAISCARGLNDRQAEGNHLGSLANAYAELGEIQRAVAFYEETLAIARDMGDRRAEGNTLGNLGIAYRHLGETRRAIEFHEEALTISREIGDRRAEGQDLGNLGAAYGGLGYTRRAIELYEQHLAIAREIGDRPGEGTALGNLGIAYARLGETGRATESYQEYLAIAREIGDRRGQGNALWNMSLALDQLGERAEAISNAQAALAIFEEIEHPHRDMVRRRLVEWRDQK